jgi:mRNA-degrading endonuclease RelE of RelBE toxin-antitoxin system
MAYTIEFSPQAREHIEFLRPFDRKTLLLAIRRRLALEPTRETRNRFRMQENPLAPWELRVGSLRAFYDVLEDRQMVLVVAVGRKVGNRLLIADEEIQL